MRLAFAMNVCRARCRATGGAPNIPARAAGARALALAALAALVAGAAGAQEPARDTTPQTPREPAVETATPAIGLRPRVRIDPFVLPRDPTLTPFGRLTPVRRPAIAIAEEQVVNLRRAMDARNEAIWGTSLLSGFGLGADTTRVPPIVQVPDPGPSPGELRDSAIAAMAAADTGPPTPGDSIDLFGEYADLGLQLNSRLEAKGERNKNERCVGSQLFNPIANCEGSFQPTFDFQFNVRTGGVVADRVHVNVDYDSEREFEASNNIQVYYEGRTDEMIERLEVGNVSFQPPQSRYITSGIPAGNYGLQATGQLGPMRFRTILAQQKGNLVKDQVYTVGERTLQSVENEVEDYQIEPRRFFFTVDPRRWFASDFPNIDLLDRQQMARLAASLPDSVRPSKVYVYRHRFGSQPPDPNGPQFLINGWDFQRGPIYELLREGVDYYIDPSQLWIALVSTASLNGDRIAVAYTAASGGTNRITGDPVVQNETRSIYANLLYDPQVEPDDSTFFREIRSVYRIGGEDIQRPTISARIVTVNGQERPVAGSAQTYLQMFGLAQPTSSASFDAENRVWPRSTDPNYNTSTGGTPQKIIRDYFIVLPSLQPFSSAGLVQPGNPANDTIYSTPSVYLYSTQHPQPLYRFRLRYSAEGGGDFGSLTLGSPQIRQNSERIVVDGETLVRDEDYTVDYELGRVTFTNPGELFPTPKQVTVRYEENPIFTAAPTNIFGLAGEFPLDNGRIYLTAISQSQKTTFNRPPLGFEPASSLVAGVSGTFNWDAPALTRAIERLPFIETSSLSTISVSGEIATSRPQPNAAGQAYVESFEGEGGIPLPLGEGAWYLSSQPAAGQVIPARFGADALDIDHAATLAWQNYGTDADGSVYTPSIQDIDPLVQLQGQGFISREPLLWLTLYPRRIGGQYSSSEGFKWVLPTLAGHRWRSVRATLAATGIDLSRVENLEFWVLVDTAPGELAKQPALVLDVGEISENTVSFQPETLVVRPTATGPDTTFFGRRLVGFDALDTERDPLSRTFNYTVNDVGLPGDLARDIVVLDSVSGTTAVRDSVRLCVFEPLVIQRLGDPRSNCTVQNARLDEEDIDLDLQLNIPSVVRDNERFYRYVIDLTDRSTYTRTGRCSPSAASTASTLCWMLVRVPFRTATDTIGQPQLRRMRAMRITMLSGPVADDTSFQTVPIARLRLVGAPWIKRQDRVIRGIAGETAAGGYVIAGLIGTNDFDSTRSVYYQSPPGVIDESDTRQTEFQTGQIQINERSLRLLAGNLDSLQRAEAYYRFPDAQKSFMGYRELRTWVRGRGNGWGADGELQFFIKMGRDADNFYLYRTPASSGNTRAAWEPEIKVQFERFFDLRARIQNAFLQGAGTPGHKRIDCTGIDSLLIASSPSASLDTLAYAACDGDGYMVFTRNPNVSPPNLAAVQELAVGMVRVANGGGMNPIQPGDTLEMWVDDIRLTQVENTPGYAGQLSVSVSAGDLGNVRVNFSRRDPYFRQLGEQPTFITDNAFDISTGLRLDKMLPARLGFALPFSLSYSNSGSEPLFISRSDLPGGGIEGLRTPENRATSMNLGLRRSTPLRHRWLGPVVNNLVLNLGHSNANTRSEYSSGKSTVSSFQADYSVVAAARTLRMPGWFRSLLGRLPGPLRSTTIVEQMRDAQLRWNPAQFRFTSGIVRNTTHNLSFQKPAETESDSATSTRGLQHLWRTATNLELRPFSVLSARWSLQSLRDLRDYPDTTAAGVAAGAERARMLGLDVGLERERSMSTGFSFTPNLGTVVRPRFDVGLTYTFLRDPNARDLLRDETDTTGAFRLPKRFDNSQSVTFGTNLELGRALAGAVASWHPLARRIALAIQPIDFTWNRQLRSTFDGSAEAPPLSYQLALGGIDDFLDVNGRRPASAGISTTVNLGHALTLPLGFRITGRYSRSGQRSWARRLGEQLGIQDNSARTWPDVTLQWNYRPTWARAVISNIGGQVGRRFTVVRTFTPPEAGALATRSYRESESMPMNGSIVWAFGGGFSTNFSFSEASTVDFRADGSRNEGTSQELGGDVGRSFGAPASWNLRSDIRTRLGFTRSEQQSYIFSTREGEQLRSRLSDNGRYSINLNVDTEMNENLLFSLTGQRSVTYDRNFNRRFTQLVVTAVMQLQFFAGELR